MGRRSIEALTNDPRTGPNTGKGCCGGGSTFFFRAWTERLIILVDDNADFLHKTDLFIVIARCCRQVHVPGRTSRRRCGGGACRCH